MDNDEEKKDGQVIESLPSLNFLVQFPEGDTLRAYLSGRMHKNFIRVLIGDKVQVVVPPTGDIGRIVKRY